MNRDGSAISLVLTAASWVLAAAGCSQNAGTRSPEGSAGSEAGPSSGSTSGDASSGTLSGSSGSSGAADSGASGSPDAAAGSSGTGTDAGGTAAACTEAAAVCKADNSGCNVGSYYLYDNQWNCGSNQCGPESAYGCANADGTVSWVVTSNQPKGNTAVLSYPAMQDNFDTKPTLGSFSTISATFAETSPRVGDYEVAWDCWFNDNANEFMVWVDNYNQTPGGSRVAMAVPLDGRTWDVWWSPSSGGGGYVVFYATATFTSGTVDLLSLFKYGVNHGWLPSSSTVDQLSFGVEVCSTDGKDATWSFTNYAITAN
jgi:hypothetical protein